MPTKRDMEKRYSINVARLKNGQHTEVFELDQSFFEYFEYSLTRAGDLTVTLDIQKYDTHLDVSFQFRGYIEVACDRCNSPYHHQVDTVSRIIYSFDKKMNFEGYEVMYVDNQESHLPITQELYDFMQLAVPIRKVPPKEVHICDAEVLALLGLDEEGKPAQPQEDTQESSIDPRWAALQKLKGGDTDSE